MNGTTNYKIGDEITYALWNGGIRTGTVIDKLDDIKDGRPGFDLLMWDGETYWGYDDQIISVEPAI